MTWYNVEEKHPEAGDKIMTLLDGCKVCRYLYMQVRFGEGLGHVKKWRYATKDEIEELEKS